MAQLSIVNEQTPLTLGDAQNLAQQNDPKYFKTGIDFVAAAKRAVPPYCKAYVGRYYDAICPITPFSTPTKVSTYGNFYEELLPTNMQDGGMLSMDILDSNNVLLEADIILQQDKTQWDLTAGDAYFRQESPMKFQAFVPLGFTVSTPIQYQLSFRRQATIPQVAGDQWDCAADDFDTLNTAWQNEIVVP